MLHHPVIPDLREKLRNMVDVRQVVCPGDTTLSDVLRRHGVDTENVQGHPFHVELNGAE